MLIEMFSTGKLFKVASADKWSPERRLNLNLQLAPHRAMVTACTVPMTIKHCYNQIILNADLQSPA